MKMGSGQVMTNAYAIAALAPNYAIEMGIELGYYEIKNIAETDSNSDTRYDVHYLLIDFSGVAEYLLAASRDSGLKCCWAERGDDDYYVGYIRDALAYRIISYNVNAGVEIVDDMVRADYDGYEDFFYRNVEYTPETTVGGGDGYIVVSGHTHGDAFNGEYY